MQITTGQQFPAFHFPTTKKHEGAKEDSVWTLVSFYLLCVDYNHIDELRSFMNFYSHDQEPTTHMHTILFIQNSKVIHDLFNIIRNKHLLRVNIWFSRSYHIIQIYHCIYHLMFKTISTIPILFIGSTIRKIILIWFALYDTYARASL